MSNWKKVSKRLLVLLLTSAIISGMMEHSWVTVMASDVEGEIEKTDVLPEEAKASEEKENPAEEGDVETGVKGSQAPEAPETGEDPETEEPQAPEAGKDPETEEPQAPEAKDSLETEGDKTSEETGSPEEETKTPEAGDSQAPEVNHEPEENPEQIVCVCTVLCGETDPAEADCQVCQEDASKCSGKALEEDPEADKETEEQALDPAAAAVKELIQTLPSLEELKALDQEGQAEVYEQVQKAYESYEGLTEEQKAQLPGAQEQLRELLEYFTELITVAPATAEQIKAAEEAMTTAMLKWDKEVDLSSYNLTKADMETIWPDVAQDNPDLFYVLMIYYTTSSDGIVQSCQFTYNPQYDRNSVAEYEAAKSKAIAEVIDNNMTDVEKALALHDYLVQHMVYDQNANNNQGIEKRNAYEALVNGIGVCQGYTLAYAALLEEVGINVDYCKSKNMNHIWNYVELEGNWYHVDLTYDDSAAASQTGETGYVSHTYFLLSDDAMSKIPADKPHNWDSNNVRCNDQTYDNFWHKTDPLNGSSIYSVQGTSYYLVNRLAVGSTTVCAGATLMRKDSNGTSEVGSFLIENNWTPYMFNMCFSRLSSSKGVLYFNVGNTVYAFDPSDGNAAPEKIYQYKDDQNRIVTGLVVTAGQMTLEISSQAGMIEEKIEVPIFSLNASETEVKVGYTTAPVLTMSNSMATGATWSKQNADGSWSVINGAQGGSYTVETGLPIGSYGYRVTATLGGRTVSAEIIITVTGQEEQKNFAFPASAKTVTYGDPDFTLAAQGAVAGSTVRYSSSNTSVAAVDPVTGAVKILGAGSAVITATASETKDYLEAQSTYTLTVAPKALAWDISALEAKDRLDLIKNGAATLYGELKLAGILEKDKADVKFVCPADKLSGVYAAVAAGSQKVTLSWKNAQDIPGLQGSKSGNYTMPSGLPQLMGKISVVDTSLPSLPESTEGKDFKVQVENGISKVPDAFQNIEHLNTPGKIENHMRLKIKESSVKVPDANIVVYDVELLVNINGTGWQKATKDNFPSTGLTVTLPYPSGTGRDTHDFVVAHMFTADMNGFRAGDVEYPAVTKTENGITFKVNGLSPVSVGWKDVENNGYNGGGSSGGPTSSADRVGAAATGDTSPVMLYILLIAGAACGILIGLYVKRKRSR